MNYVWLGSGAATAAGSLPSGSPLQIATSGAAALDLGGGTQTAPRWPTPRPGPSSATVLSSNTSAPSILTLSASGGSTTFSGVIAGGSALGAINLVMSGSGTQVLAGDKYLHGFHHSQRRNPGYRRWRQRRINRQHQLCDLRQ